MALVPASSSGPGTSGGTLTPSSSEGQGGGATGPAAQSVIATPSALAAAGAPGLGVPTLGLANNTWQVANMAQLIPVAIPVATTVRGFLWFNAGVVSGNVDAGLYNEDGTRVIAVGSTAQAGAGAVQTASCTATAVAAGSYLMALVLDNVTGQLQQVAYLAATNQRAWGIASAAGVFPLPASVTVTSPSALGNVLYWYGVSLVTVF